MEVSARISDLIAAREEGKVQMSVEFFPPKTDAGVTSLYNLVEKLKVYKPLFGDVTWGAGGTTSDLTLSLCTQIKAKSGLNPNMHLTCTNMERQKVVDALNGCKEAGITNIVALRGDPPAGQEAWAAVEGGFNCALDLVKFIRAEHGDYFCLSIAGYPEGHPNRMTVVKDMAELTESERGRCAVLTNEKGEEEITVCTDADFEKELDYLKEKVDAGANLIITQLFFDVDVFTTFVTRCREKGITVPIVPGIMCVASAGGFQRMIRFCKTRVPKSLMDAVNAIVEDADMKALGISYGTEMCLKLLDSGVKLLHFYTLNASFVTAGIMANLKDSAYKFAGFNDAAAVADGEIGAAETVFTAVADTVAAAAAVVA
jgi:methylenetetrahydrofolate reductase (NADPH)